MLNKLTEDIHLMADSSSAFSLADYKMTDRKKCLQDHKNNPRCCPNLTNSQQSSDFCTTDEVMERFVRLHQPYFVHPSNYLSKTMVIPRSKSLFRI